jgi:hypothetical protein
MTVCTIEFIINIDALRYSLERKNTRDMFAYLSVLCLKIFHLANNLAVEGAILITMVSSIQSDEALLRAVKERAKPVAMMGSVNELQCLVDHTAAEYINTVRHKPRSELHVACNIDVSCDSLRPYVAEYGKHYVELCVAIPADRVSLPTVTAKMLDEATRTILIDCTPKSIYNRTNAFAAAHSVNY